ncbi:methyl farnesoate epoxidase [Folsomia candida]|uniref:methyl farnesoate epoxidase n=1 Tax=Folsomia candida TaxID=158441 RepID=UPI000B8EEB76|nr:methyl farnesoate epoxidase [Folsomia candida]
MFWTWIFLFVTGALIYKYFIKDDDEPKKKLPPGPPPSFILGNLPLLSSETKKGIPPYKVLRTLSKQYGHVMSMHFGSTYQVIFDDYETIRDQLSSDLWSDRYVDSWILERSFGKELGIFFGNGESWKELRRFSLRTLRDFGFGKQKSQETFIEEELEHLLARMESARKEGSDVVCMKKFFSVSALNIIWSLIAGFRFSEDDKQLQLLVHLMSQIVRLLAVGEDIIAAYPFLRHILPRFTKRGRERKKFLNEIHGMFKSILDERRKGGKYKIEQRDFIDVFLTEIDAHANDTPEFNYYTEEQFLVLALDFFLAGTETTSSTMEFAFVYMILYPEVQRKVQIEIDQVVDPSNFPCTLDNKRMPYTEAVLLEVQRIATVVPIFSRAASMDHYNGDYFIKKGTMGVFSLYSSNYSEETWGDPLVFRPERFLDAKKNVINAQKIMAFGLGKRICAGEVLAKANLFKFFTSFLQRYTFELSPEHGKPSTEPILGTVMSPHPFWAVVKARKPGSLVGVEE